MSRVKPHLPSDPSPSPLPSPQSTNSFWHSQPSPLLTAHRSTRELPEKADVVVIGSGMTGASVAHHLLNDQSTVSGENQKLDVVMLEAREACWGATGRNGGHCQPLLLEHPHDPSIPAFELLNFRALHTLSDLKQIDCEFVPQPGVRAIYSLSNLHETELALHTLQQTLPEMAQLTRITRDENELIALRVPGALGAVVTNVAARMWPYKFVARILEDLITAYSLPGGDFNLQTLTPVTSLCRSPSSSDWQVCTKRGIITAPKVILATNAYTSHLLPALRDLIVPVRGQMSALHPLPSVAGPNRLRTSFGFAGDGIDDYLIQRPNETGGHLMFGGGRQCLPCVGETDDSVIDDKTARYLRGRLVDALGLPESKAEATNTQRVGPGPSIIPEQEHSESEPQTRIMGACAYCRKRKIRCSISHSQFPPGNDERCTNCIRFKQPCGSFRSFGTLDAKLERQQHKVEFQASHEWTGIMGFSRDDLPWVGPVPRSLLPTGDNDNNASANEATETDTGLFMAAGYTGHGMPNTWLCGAAVAKMAMGLSNPAEFPSESAVVDFAVASTGLPRAYLISEGRVRMARELEGVGARDSAEMDKGKEKERVASGYA